MDLNKQQFSIDFAGQPLTLSVSKIGEQADAAVIGTYGDTSVLVTAVMGKQDKDINYFPLVVDYEEKFYAAGKIIGSRFVRREGRPSENAILSGRLIDRSIRPLFNHAMRRDVQLIITVLSYDEANDPDFIALLSASTALLISPIPWNGPIAGVRLARTADGKTIINPTNQIFEENKNILFDAFISATSERINMIELGGNEAREKDIVETFGEGHEEIKKLIEFQKEIAKKIGQAKIEIEIKKPSQELKEKISVFLNNKIEEALYIKDKTERQNRLYELKENLKQYLLSESISEFEDMETIWEEEIDKLVHKNILESGKRPDGRQLDQIPELYTQTGIF